MIGNDDVLKIKVFGSNGSCCCEVVAGGETAEFADLNGDRGRSTAQWDEHRESVAEHIEPVPAEMVVDGHLAPQKVLDEASWNRLSAAEQQFAATHCSLGESTETAS